jgi:hypothetical protein
MTSQPTRNARYRTGARQPQARSERRTRVPMHSGNDGATLTAAERQVIEAWVAELERVAVGVLVEIGTSLLGVAAAGECGQERSSLTLGRSAERRLKNRDWEIARIALDYVAGRAVAVPVARSSGRRERPQRELSTRTRAAAVTGAAPTA